MTERGRTVIVAGATGDLGGRIVRALVAKGAPVAALVRQGTAPWRLANLPAAVRIADFASTEAIAAGLGDAACVVSALSGLEEVVIDIQGRLLDAAVMASVPRFIPSDFAIDFRKLPPDSNRNLDLREAFRTRAEAAPIRLTSILNGAFMDMLTGTIPIIQHSIRRVLFWGSADQPMDFTTISDTAAYTARVAMDPKSPRILNICGARVSARDIAAALGRVRGRPYGLLPAGTIGTLGLTIGVARKLSPGAPDEVYPAWQGMQYMRNLFAGEGMLDTPFDNDRYPGMAWTSLESVLESDPRP
jgi:uncharacterized protein YbjT (DUF2867 family)